MMYVVTATSNHWRSYLCCMWLQQARSSVSAQDDLGMACRI